MELTFEWDEEKAEENLRKHKVSFEEGKTVFNDPFLMTFSDPDHSRHEQRFVSIGSSSKRRVLIVVHTDRGNNIRIISSRRATRSERRAYEESNF
jgi:Uncharacterized protein conserved in bacteria